jgi:hypothetical protein
MYRGALNNHFMKPDASAEGSKDRSHYVPYVAMLSVRSVYSPWIVLRKRVGIRPLLIDKLNSITIPQDGALLRKDSSYCL